MRRVTIIALVFLMASAGAVFAGSVGTLTGFTPNTPAHAQSVNDNFTAVKTAVDDNAADITTNADGISSHETRIGVLESYGDLSSVAATIAALKSTISSLQSQVAVLEAKLAYMYVDTATVNGLPGPHVVFVGTNLHVQNGQGQTDTLNGLGNLIVGYNEAIVADTTQRMGSHNLIVGMEHVYPSWSGFVAGLRNSVTKPYASISGGWLNTASGNYSSVSGGNENTANGTYSSISGGSYNTADSIGASISGGQSNIASNEQATVSGGSANTANGLFSTVSGGQGNSTSALYGHLP